MLKYFLKEGVGMFFIVIIVILKLMIFGMYYYDFSRTKKLLKQDRTIKRVLSFMQKVEVYGMNVVAVAQILIPLEILGSHLYSILAHVIVLILVYFHLNRWVFVSKKSIICRAELYRMKNVQKAKYEHHRLTFKVGSRQFKILYPLVTVEHLDKTII